MKIYSVKNRNILAIFDRFTSGEVRKYIFPPASRIKNIPNIIPAICTDFS
jgi:hypothetical protein